MESQVELLRTSLAAAGEGAVDVRGALCFANVDGLPMLQRPSLRGVQIDGARMVAKLARRTGPLSAEHVEQLWTLIGRAYPAA